ncbi:hypothetical protein [Planctomicrobium piriforme]|uniref:Transmembrane protein n=1 Tax=Planctomicrobium piriforme TaxID=1576369 RepID=A0A1I3TAR0_9PLAN|nr:hypothetical protein [Planctomicrobium piriforme]SFJ67582.1 hypothetical protein SAMN05421753_12839 [Planctomicrobium piriforme]
MDSNSPTQHDEQSPPPRPWPEVESKIQFPDAWPSVASLSICFLFVIGFYNVIVSADPRTSDFVVVTAVAILFGSLIATGLVQLIIDRFRNRAFRHASDDVLSSVPSWPVLGNGQVTFSKVTHNLEVTEFGLRLTPKPHLFRMRNRLICLWATCFAVFLGVFLWQATDFAALTKVFSICMSTMAVSTAVGLLVRSLNEIAKKRWPVDFDFQTGVCRITDGKSEICYPISRLVAVQLCCAVRVTDPGERTLIYALELNLVWKKPRSKSKSASRHERTTVMNQSTASAEFTSLAVNLARQLKVPLLNHATSLEWKLESRRCKTRPYEPLKDGLSC